MDTDLKSVEECRPVYGCGADPTSSKKTSQNDEITIVNKGGIDLARTPTKKTGADGNLNAVDLIDLLGSNWPESAGGAAMILNKTACSTLDAVNVATENYKKQTKKIFEVIWKIKQIMKMFSNVDNSSQSIPTTVLELFNQDNNIINGTEIPGPKLSIGCLVEISGNLFGVIRWIGVPSGSVNTLVGIELEDELSDSNLLTSDGTFNGVRLFQCPEKRAVFVSPTKCRIDRRFIDMDGSSDYVLENDVNAAKFGHVDCPSIIGACAPICVSNFKNIAEICGKFKGIQGHYNSCYLDATLFSMFAFTSVFDSILYRYPAPEDIPYYTDVQKVLRDDIVNPLRKIGFVRADRVMKLRKLLDQLSSISGLTSEEKDPEEFLNSLLVQIMKVEPPLKLSSGEDSYFYQLFVEKDEKLSFPSVQQLFEQSFYSSNIKLKEVPSCLIIQMPRFGKNYKMYQRILPSQVLDITDVIDDSPRQCSVCGILAEYECRDCFGNLQETPGLESSVFCQNCLHTIHMHTMRTNHESKKLSVPKDFKIMANHMVVPRLYMELFAVVCIETSHYVSFVKTGLDPNSPWIFFDSMADRNGEKNGYNIPEMTCVPEMPEWLSDEGARAVNESSPNDKALPEHAKRLFCDAYMCMYQSTDVMMYH